MRTVDDLIEALNRSDVVDLSDICCFRCSKFDEENGYCDFHGEYCSETMVCNKFDSVMDIWK